MPLASHSVGPILHDQHVSKTLQERCLLEGLVGRSARRVLVERVRTDDNIDSILVIERTEEVGYVVPLQVDIGGPLNAALVIPAGVPEPVALGVVTLGSHGKAMVLQQKTVLEHIEKTLSP